MQLNNVPYKGSQCEKCKYNMTLKQSICNEEKYLTVCTKFNEIHKYSRIKFEYFEVKDCNFFDDKKEVN